MMTNPMRGNYIKVIEKANIDSDMSVYLNAKLPGVEITFIHYI